HMFFVPKGKALTVAAPGLVGVTAGATVITTPAATVAVATQPAHGKLELKADGSFVYTPERNFTGSDSFTYTTTRNAVTSSPGTVTLIVQ
ncbi:MAG TPA: Ig-like domain-containing protein, partial [Vicinamibacterales bacterium]|nr:Ig-like domain-containing protein [Vicinamibacterales bacterium]